MACCLLCFSDEPTDGVEGRFRRNEFQRSLKESCLTPCCCFAFMCPPCSAYYIRYKALDGDMTRYECCQGYFTFLCIQPGNCAEASIPAFCLALESCCCLGCSVSSSRMYVMDHYDLRFDPCDNRLIRFNNCLQMLTCICDILSICVEEAREWTWVLHHAADCVFYTLYGCMVAQVSYEIDYQRSMEASQRESAVPLNAEIVPVTHPVSSIDECYKGYTSYGTA